MAANTQVIRLLQKQRAKLESKVSQAAQSISAWKGVGSGNSGTTFPDIPAPSSGGNGGGLMCLVL